MPADPGANLGAQRLPTSKDDIGHVQPSFDSIKRYNTLVVRPDLRISLRLGKIEDLFPHEPNTDEGRRERLQVLCYFYFPLGHAKAMDAYKGVAAKTDNSYPVGFRDIPAIEGAWDHFKKYIAKGDETQSDAKIQELLVSRVVDGGSLPPPREVKDYSTTPVQLEDVKAENIRKIRIPGGFTVLKGSGLSPNFDSAYPQSSLGEDMYKFETQFRNDNPVVGKIPLIVKVEKLDPASGEWKPYKDAPVYLQLQVPDPFLDFDPLRGMSTQFNRPPLNEATIGPPAVASGVGPAKLDKVEFERTSGASRTPHAKDPQQWNAPDDRGGIAKVSTTEIVDSSDVAGIVFSTAEVPGFHKDHSGTRKLSHKPYHKATAGAAGGKHAHSVKALTNEEGEAGFIFTPSRCGGDRYKLRAYVGPPATSGGPGVSGPGSDGTGVKAVSLDTGTFVMWRNMLVSRYVRQPIGNPGELYMREARALLLPGAPVVEYTDATPLTPTQTTTVKPWYLGKVGCENTPAFHTADFSDTATAVASFSTIVQQWARGFVELETASAQGGLPEDLTEAEWLAARKQAYRDMFDNLAAKSLTIDIDKLFCFSDTGTFVPSMDNAMVFLPMRSRRVYDGMVVAGKRISSGGTNDRDTVAGFTFRYALAGFLRHISSNGYKPGMTIIQAGHSFGWQVHGISGSSGIALPLRGVSVTLGATLHPTAVTVPAVAPAWMPYSYASNVAHEMGHACYRAHANTGGAGGPKADQHQPTGDAVCVMGYAGSEGQFCARCLFGFRGWDISKIP